jgi:type II secretory pathway pseudopilin PulG
MAGARRFRLLVTVVIIGVLAWFLLNTLERETRAAEEMAANMVIGQLRSALVVKGAEVLLSQKGRLEDYREMNPFELLEHQWASYTGVCEPQTMKPATWCFWQRKQKNTVNSGKGWLIYNPRQPITINRRTIQAGELAGWKVTTEFADQNHNGLQESNERSTGLKLIPVELTNEIVNTLGTVH